MSTTNVPKNAIEGWESVRAEWLARLTALIDNVQHWADELGWATRRIEAQIEDSQIGDHPAPALLMQEGTTRVLLEPFARFAPGTEGVVDLYVMPAYDDIARLFFRDGAWHVEYAFRDGPAGRHGREPESERFSHESFQRILASMTGNAE